jgi:hypothetical protein
VCAGQPVQSQEVLDWFEAAGVGEDMDAAWKHHAAAGKRYSTEAWVIGISAR